MNTLVPRVEILPTAQRRLWAEFRTSLPASFVLYGGTALALRTGSRQSEDFGFFTNDSIDAHTLAATLPCLRKRHQQATSDDPPTDDFSRGPQGQADANLTSLPRHLVRQQTVQPHRRHDEGERATRRDERHQSATSGVDAGRRATAGWPRSSFHQPVARLRRPAGRQAFRPSSLRR
jgi:hypothetical protein